MTKNTMYNDNETGKEEKGRGVAAYHDDAVEDELYGDIEAV